MQEIKPPAHRYYPPDLHIPSFVANTYDVPTLLAIFASGLTGILTVTWLIARSVHPGLSQGKMLTILWFTMSGCIHLFFEGYYITHHTTLPSRTDVFAQLWKEYALSDSRYLISDRFIVAIETLTVLLISPLCLLTAVLTALPPTSHYHIYHIPLQLTTSITHFYSASLYFAAAYTDHRSFTNTTNATSWSRPEFRYFWVYFVGFNAVWLVVPGYFINQSVTAMGATTRAFEKSERILQVSAEDAEGAAATEKAAVFLANLHGSFTSTATGFDRE